MTFFSSRVIGRLRAAASSTVVAWTDMCLSSHELYGRVRAHASQLTCRS